MRFSRSREEKKAKEEAISREAESKAVLGFVEDHIFAAARPEGQEGGLGRDVTLRKAIESAIPYVEKSFAGQPLIEARLRMTLARSSRLLGDGAYRITASRSGPRLYTRHHGPDSPDTLASMDAMGSAYADLGQDQQAVKLDEETLALRKARLGTERPETLMSMVRLAHHYIYLGRYADAAKLCEEALKMQRSKLGPDHPDTLEGMHVLALCYRHLGRLAEAVKLEEETLALRKINLGLSNWDTQRSIMALDALYYSLGRSDDAIKLCEETLGAPEGTAWHVAPDNVVVHERPRGALHQGRPPGRGDQAPGANDRTADSDAWS